MTIFQLFQRIAGLRISVRNQINIFLNVVVIQKNHEHTKLCKNILLTVPRRYFFCGSFMFLFCLVSAMFCARLFICALWSPAGKGMTSWLSFVVSSVSLSLSHWYPGSGVVLDCIDS